MHSSMGPCLRSTDSIVEAREANLNLVVLLRTSTKNLQWPIRISTYTSIVVSIISLMPVKHLGFVRIRSPFQRGPGVDYLQIRARNRTDWPSRCASLRRVCGRIIGFLPPACLCGNG